MLTATQLAQLIRSTGALNDTKKVIIVLEQLKEGDALQNVDHFLTQLKEDGKVGYSLSLGKANSCALNRTFSEALYCGCISLH